MFKIAYAKPVATSFALLLSLSAQAILPMGSAQENWALLMQEKIALMGERDSLLAREKPDTTLLAGLDKELGDLEILLEKIGSGPAGGRSDPHGIGLELSLSTEVRSALLSFISPSYYTVLKVKPFANDIQIWQAAEALKATISELMRSPGIRTAESSTLSRASEAVDFIVGLLLDSERRLQYDKHLRAYNYFFDSRAPDFRFRQNPPEIMGAFKEPEFWVWAQAHAPISQTASNFWVYSRPIYECALMRFAILPAFEKNPDLARFWFKQHLENRARFLRADTGGVFSSTDYRNAAVDLVQRMTNYILFHRPEAVAFFTSDEERLKYLRFLLQLVDYNFGLVLSLDVVDTLGRSTSQFPEEKRLLKEAKELVGSTLVQLETLKAGDPNFECRTFVP